MPGDFRASKVTPAHQAKLAYVYVRQSSLSQVTRHTASTDLQYHLVERAIQLGWPRERVVLIDEDLGKSGASAQERSGFQRLLAEIGLARVGLVLSWDASRLARNNSDWHHLIEVCSLFGTLLADGESLYDPGAYHDRLLLGLSGMMSEAELHHLKQRLQAGAWHKAEQGLLRQGLPVGLVRLEDGQVVLHPDEEVQARLRLVFAKFEELRSGWGVVRYLQRAQLPLPVRPVHGGAAASLAWRVATRDLVLTILQNPAYAGAYVYGRYTHDPARRQNGRPGTGRAKQPIDKWPVLLHNVYPAYISWEQFLAHQAQLQANRTRYEEGQPGVPRQGASLLQGIVRCGRCGLQMRLGYSGPSPATPMYICRAASGPNVYCQSVKASLIDAEVERQVLDALAPDQIELALAAVEALEQEQAQRDRQWRLRVERARYEAARAQRQYDAVEPENRLVARSLERQWEEKLRAAEQVEQEYHRWQAQRAVALGPAEREWVLALGSELPRVWRAPTTTAADRKQFARLVIQTVLLDAERAPGQVWLQINWQTGATSEHWLTRPVGCYDQHPHREVLEERVRHLVLVDECGDDEVAAALNAEGFRNAHDGAFTAPAVKHLRARLELPAARVCGPHPERWADGSYSIEGLAAVLGAYPGTIYKWLREGRLQGRQHAPRCPWHLFVTDDQLADLRTRLRRTNPGERDAS
jgi:DNA invertase Pin-like site-specific DNA recombinase